MPVFDVVISMSVLQHMTEPLRHLHFLRSVTRGALFLVTNVWDDDDLLIRYGEPNAVFHDYAFPWCFDNSNYMSERLLRLSLSRAGFTRVVDLAFRLPATAVQVEAQGRHDYAAPVPPAEVGTAPVETGPTASAEPIHHLIGRALLCFVDGEPRGSAADLRLGCLR
jgi:hypothetical protein